MDKNNEVAAKMQQIHEELYKIEVELLPNGVLPSKSHFNDAGFDVYATSDFRIDPGQIIKHPLNIKMKLPVGCYAEIKSKSGLGAQGILVYAGVIDEGYRGVPHVVMTNLTSGEYAKEIFIKQGQKIAQFTLQQHSNHYFIVQVDYIDVNTDRSIGGFGSSGL